MHLTPKEQERLLIFTAAEMARRRKRKGIKLNYPEAVAYISDEIQEKAREGDSMAADLSSTARRSSRATTSWRGSGHCSPRSRSRRCFPTARSS